MPRRLAHVLLAFVFALATALPVSMRAMPMPADTTGMAVQQHCPSCPHHPRSSTSPDKMPACQVLACVGTVATLPGPIPLPGRVLVRSTYAAAPPVRWTAAPPAPDPFPPRPIALV